MYTNLRFSNRRLERTTPHRREYSSFSPAPRQKDPGFYDARTGLRGHYTDPREDKLFIKNHDLRNPFLPVLDESNTYSYEDQHNTSLFALPRRHIDHSRVYNQPPDDVFEAVFEIYATRFSTKYNQPIGAGVLISPTLALTNHSSLPTIDSASRSHIKFINNGEIYKFAPSNQFKTHSILNLTVVSVEPINKSHRHGVRLRHQFYLQEHSRVYCVSGSSGLIEQLDSRGFFFYHSESLLQGTALFDYNWEFVGLTLISVSHARFNEGRRVDLIYNFVNSTSDTTIFRLAAKAEPIMSHRGFRTIGHQPQKSDVVHWLLWGGRAVMTYDMSASVWNSAVAETSGNISEYDWCFLPNSRVALLPDQTLMIVGGTLGTEGSHLALRYFPFQNTVSQVCSMLNQRHSCAVAYLDEYVYVVGGIRHSKSAERYSLSRDFWEHMLPTNYERFEASAVGYRKFVFVVGGSASEAAGQTIERFNTVVGEWDVLRILLPRPLINPGLCAISHSRIAILGGRKTRRVYALQNSYSSQFNLQEATPFPDDIESVYPVVYFQDQRQLLIFNSSEYRDRPVLIKYAENCFTSGEFMYLK